MPPPDTPPMTDIFAPITLSGQHVRLEPLAPEHLEGLIEAAKDGELWRLWYTSIPEPDGMAAEIDRRLALNHARSMVPFTVFDGQGKISGMTTFMAVDEATPRVEIGYTWYAKRVQRTGLNTEAKLLLFTHAFEALGCKAVEFRTHWMNQQSRRAIERLGAKQDGALRNYSVARDGSVRDTVVYSIIAGEWPAVKVHLMWLMQRSRPN